MNFLILQLTRVININVKGMKRKNMESSGATNYYERLKAAITMKINASYSSFSPG